jgi:putative ABC transport system permease protein
MRTLRLAWRNVFRQKRRTLTTLGAVIVGLAGLVVFQGYLNQLMVGFRDSTIRGGLGHVQIAAAPRYFTDGEFSPSSYPLADAPALEKELSADPRVVAVFPSTGFTAIAGFGDKATTLLVKAYPADRMSFGTGGSADDTADTFTLGTLTAGAWAPAGPTRRLVLGATAARILKAGVGDVVTLMVLLPGGALNGQDFTVAAVYEAAGKDKIFAFTDFGSAQAFTGQAEPPVIHVLARAADQAAGLAALVPPGHAVKLWPELATYFVQVNTMFAGFLSVIRAILLLITLFLLGNNMNRIVFERMREWGTLRALGTKARGILGLVVAEGTIQGVVGGLLGIAAGFVVALGINLAGGIPYVDGTVVRSIRVVPDDQTVWWNLVPVVATAALAAFLPALRATRMSPSDALRCP